jgi:hypothetical protein
MIMWMHAWHGNYDAMQLIRIKRNRNSDTYTYGSSCFTTRQFKCSLAWKDKVWVSYTKLNEVVIPYLGYPNYSICYVLSEMQNTTSRHDARCKQ